MWSHGTPRGSDTSIFVTPMWSLPATEIEFVSKGYAGAADTIFDGHDRMVMPGMVNTHTHLGTATKSKGTWEELGSPLMYMSTLFEYMSLIRLPEDAVDDYCNYALAELLKSGCTTMVEMTTPYPEWIANVERSGIRAYLALHFSAPRATTRSTAIPCATSGTRPRVARQFEGALKLIGEIERRPDGRIRGRVYPARVESCTDDLMRDAAAAARERGVPLTTHCAQTVVEFREMMHRHGKTPRGIPITRATMLAHSTSSNVAGRRSAINSATGRLLR